MLVATLGCAASVHAADQRSSSLLASIGQRQFLITSSFSAPLKFQRVASAQRTLTTRKRPALNLQKEKSFTEQRSAAQEARERMLARFKARPKADDPAMIAARAEREAIARAREARTAEREAARREAEEKIRAEQAARAEAERREKAAREAAEAAARAEAEAARKAEEARIAAERIKTGGLFDAVQYAQMRANRGRR